MAVLNTSTDPPRPLLLRGNAAAGLGCAGGTCAPTAGGGPEATKEGTGAVKGRGSRGRGRGRAGGGGREGGRGRKGGTAGGDTAADSAAAEDLEFERARREAQVRARSRRGVCWNACITAVVCTVDD